jgi:hypothetical protein
MIAKAWVEAATALQRFENFCTGFPQAGGDAESGPGNLLAS